jgi:cholesterol oxidase
MSETHFDAVIVGSGFGGSVMAYRLAEAGLRVCVLERGKAYSPGSFPRSPYAMSRNFWDPSEGLHGMFNVWSFRGLGGIVSSGLGGGSLIYGNVLLRKDPKTFVKEDVNGGGWEYWPVCYEDLEPHYECVEQMLNGQPYPFEPQPEKRVPARQDYDRTPKTNAMHEAAQRLGLEWKLPKLAVTFANSDEEPQTAVPIRGAPENIYGRPHLTCALTGECNIGCNYASKNTLDLTYLSLAKLRHGAEIWTRCEVKAFAPRGEGGGYTIEYVDHNEAVEDEKRTVDLPRHTVTAKRLVLAAGSFGSTFLLLKMKKYATSFSGLSEKLGTRFNGNGDLLTLVVKSLQEDGGSHKPRILDAGYGPVITSAIRVPDEMGGEGSAYYIEDGGYPQFASWIIETSNQFAFLRRGLRLLKRLARGWLRLDVDSDVGAEIASFIGTAATSSSTLPMFAMGRDVPDGNMRLTDNDLLDIDWRLGRSTPYFHRVRESAHAIAQSLNASFRDNPLWYLSRVVTVHPLGGCPMGRNEKEGVVNSYGEVHGYPGLYVADGSVMPGPVGPNPSLTIAAIANRSAEHIIANKKA